MTDKIFYIQQLKEMTTESDQSSQKQVKKVIS